MQDLQEDANKLSPEEMNVNAFMSLIQEASKEHHDQEE